MILTGKEIKALAEFVGLKIAAHTEPVEEEILETEILISPKEHCGRKYKIANYYEYPEEGCIDLSDF